ncbi:MAG: hypothetical protein KDE09_08245 [Anaerolineales bacterium]|nr:hypothetical protein [Anaerolineales bacterium]
MAFLKDTFTISKEVQEVIAPFLDWVEQLVPADQMRRLAHHQAPIQLSVQRLSEWDIHPDVWDKVIYAIKNRLMVEFDYVSPHHNPDEPRRLG